MKKILIIASIAILSVSLFGYKKYKDGMKLFSQMQFRLKKGAGLKNIRFSGNNIIFDATVELVNPTRIPFSISTGSLITLKRLEYYDQTGSLIAFSDTHITGITIAPESVTELPPITTTLNVVQGIFYAASGMPEVTRIKATIEVFGKNYTIFKFK